MLRRVMRRTFFFKSTGRTADAKRLKKSGAAADDFGGSGFPRQAVFLENDREGNLRKMASGASHAQLAKEHMMHHVPCLPKSIMLSLCPACQSILEP